MSGSRTPTAFDNALDPRRCLAVLKARSSLICCIALIASLGGLVLSYALPKRYEASCTVSIEQSVISDLVKGIAITPSIDAKLRILKVSLLSRSMLIPVMRILDMDLSLRNPTEQEVYIENLRKNINLQHDERKGLFVLSYTDSNPVRARDFVNTLTQRYIEESTSSKRQQSIDATSFLSEQIKVFQKRIELAQQDIDAFKSEKGMYLGLSEYLLQNQTRAAEQRLDELQIRENESKAKLELLSPGSRLRKVLEDKELALQSMRSTYTDRHPLVIRAREDIRALKAEIQAEESKGRGELSETVEYRQILVELQSLREMKASLTESIEKNNRYLHELPEVRTRLSELEQRKNNETHIYEQLVARYGQSEVSKQMELQDKSISFNVIDAAVTPTTHVFPPRPLIIIGGIIFGLGLGGGCAIGLDLLRPKIRSREDLEVFGVEVLAILPPLSAVGLGTKKWPWKMPALTGAVIIICLAVAGMELLRLPYAESAFRLIKSYIHRWA